MKKSVKLLFISICILFAITIIQSNSITFAEEKDQWIVTHHNEKYYSIAYGKDLYVAVGQDGVIATSKDGVDWVYQDSGVKLDLNHIALINNSFVCIGDNGTVMMSTDGVNWINNSIDTEDTIDYILWQEDKYVAATFGKVYLSVDGKEWSEVLLPDYMRFNSIATDGERLVGVGDFGVILVSQDGEKWIEVRPMDINSDYDLKTIIYNKGKFFAVGGSIDYGIILSSEDGLKWEVAKKLDYELNDIIYTNKSYVAVGDGISLISKYGTKWTAKEFDTINYIKKIIWKDKYYGVDICGDIFMSTDGLSWSLAKDSLRYDIHSIAWNGNVFVAVGTDGVVLFSYDGMYWEETWGYKDYRLFDVEFLEDKIVARY